MTKTLAEIGRLFGEGTPASLSDAQLLERFAARGDDETFEAIVARHGPLVLSACRSALGPRDQAEVDDAFQATFIILARRAGTFPLHGSLAGWLYRVARRAGRQARLGATRRRARERVVAGRRLGQADPPHDPAIGEVRDLVHQELALLPERYRAPILLCDLNGLTRDEAAEAIGCPPGTVAGRLFRARELLRDRLARRGVTSATVPVLGVVHHPALFKAAARVAAAVARGEVVAVAAAGLAARASGRWFAPRVSGGLRTLTTLATSGVAAAVLSFGAAGKLVDSPEAPPPSPAAAVATPPAVEGDGQAPIDPEDPAVADLYAGKVVDTDGKPLDGAKVYLIARAQTASSPISPEGLAVRAVTGNDGRFRFSAKDMTAPSLDGLPARRSGLLIAAAEGFGPAWEWNRSQGPEPVAERTLTLSRDDVPIRGQLLGPEGRPLAGAAVRLERLFSPRIKNLDDELAKAADPRRLFDLDRGSLPSGDARSLPGVTGEAVTDADGRFRLAGLGRDRLAWLTVLGPGVVDTRVQVLTREIPEFRPPADLGADSVTHGASFTLTLQPGRTVSGVVRDRATGRPLPGVRVGLDDQETLRSALGRPPILTDAQGRFSIGGISADSGAVPNIYAVPGPGRANFPGKAKRDEAGEIVIDCPAGIPYRLMLQDEAGRPVEAEVTYSAIYPNGAFNRMFWDHNIGGFVLSRAARQPDGSYLGVALPGPGVVTAKLPRGVPYRPAHVDPKAYFPVCEADWTTARGTITSFGNHDTLSIVTGTGPIWSDQDDYAAIVLLNNPDIPGPLELVATVSPPSRPRMVSLVDPEGQPIVGARSRGLTNDPSDVEPKLRASTFPLTMLHPDRSRRITFVDEARKLVGFLMAQGDADAPSIVKLQPWATVTGRLVDDQGRPIAFDGPAGGHPSPASLETDAPWELAAPDDPNRGVFPTTTTGVDGRFRIDQLVPGQVYNASFSLGRFQKGSATLLDHAVLAPGEVRDLGDIRTLFKPRAVAAAAP